MMIDKIGGINPLNNVQNTRRSNGAAQVRSDADSISVSNEAKEKAAVYYMNQVAAETPNVRADRIAEVKAKLQNPNYLNDSVILYVSIPSEIDGTDDKFKVYLPSEFSIFEVKQYNPSTGKYDTNIEMKLIEGETSKYIRTNDVSDTLGSTTYEIKLSK